MQFLFQNKECVSHLRLSHPAALVSQRNEACAVLVAGRGTASTAQALPPGGGLAPAGMGSLAIWGL